MRRLLVAAASLGLLCAAAAAPDKLDFEPKVGATGTRVTLHTVIPEGAQVVVGGKAVAVIEEAKGIYSFLIPPLPASTAFLEVVKGGTTLSKSAVPFVVSGPSVVATPKLVGLKEAIDVFGYSDPKPEGGSRPEPKARPILKFDDDEVLTVGEPSPYRLGPAVETGDLSAAGKTGMAGTGLLITARPPKKKTPVPLPPPPPEN